MALLDHDGTGLRPPPLRRVRGRPDSTLAPAFDAHAGNDNRSVSLQSACELDCLAGILPDQMLRDAAARGRHLDIGADRVLIAWGAIDEAVYGRLLARHTGIAIETFADVTRGHIPLRDDQLGSAAQYGIVPICIGDDLIVVHAPRGIAARRMVEFARRFPALKPRFRIAAPIDIDDVLLHRTENVIARDAADGLRRRAPSMSAAPKLRTPLRLARISRFGGGAAIAGLLMLPIWAAEVGSQLLAIWFVAAIGLRLAAAFLPKPPRCDLPPLADAELPVYTVIVALYREARSVAPLLRALDALDYPREKLDIVLAIEPDDADTRAAITRFGAMPHLRVVVAPDIVPRTKPKALNVALPFARGSFITVFDAEDRPDPGQLRAALDAFRTYGDDVACVQASLCIHNVADSLFTRMFAAEYAGQFDAVLPGLSAIKLPLPLGGSSNHFRTEVLRAVGGWDSWNVTEDADLGLRLTRYGYRAVTFDSSTQEEAPITFAPWLKQRSRWMKGWMQTWIVHMRDPITLWRETGWRGVATLNLVMGGNLLSALVYPAFIAGLMTEIAGGGRWLLDGLLTPVHFAAFAGGLVATVAIGLRGLACRGRLRDGWILLLTPLYWGCLSIATWRALWQLIRDPYHWEKTEHGLTRANLTTDSASGRPPPRPACA